MGGGRELETMEMKLYRAAKYDSLYTGCCFAADLASAEAYTDNPGFGGPVLFSATIDTDSARIVRFTTIRELADALVDAVSTDDLIDFFDTTDAYDIAELLDATGTLYPWTVNPKLEAFLGTHFDWAVYPDDYPVGCETWCILSDSAASATEDRMVQL